MTTSILVATDADGQTDEPLRTADAVTAGTYHVPLLVSPWRAG
jgi:5-hydroxyisourate hydrolase-like protein (transthyretin family)